MTEEDAHPCEHCGYNAHPHYHSNVVCRRYQDLYATLREGLAPLALLAPCQTLMPLTRHIGWDFTWYEARPCIHLDTLQDRIAYDDPGEELRDLVRSEPALWVVHYGYCFLRHVLEGVNSGRSLGPVLIEARFAYASGLARRRFASNETSTLLVSWRSLSPKYGDCRVGELKSLNESGRALVVETFIMPDSESPRAMTAMYSDEWGGYVITIGGAPHTVCFDRPYGQSPQQLVLDAEFHLPS